VGPPGDPALYMNKSEPPPPKDDSPYFWSKLVQPFLRRSQKCEKLMQDAGHRRGCRTDGISMRKVDLGPSVQID